MVNKIKRCGTLGRRIALLPPRHLPYLVLPPILPSDAVLRQGSAEGRALACKRYSSLVGLRLLHSEDRSLERQVSFQPTKRSAQSVFLDRSYRFYVFVNNSSK